MSGSFVQRGEPACVPKEIRAASAVAGGASMVLEIPFPYSCLSAEGFADAGVRLLNGVGFCSHLAFGSECADSGLLTALADALCEDSVLKSIQVYQKEHPTLTYIRARSAVLRTHFGEKAAVSENPNDILGIEYIKAIKRQSACLIPVALPRSVGRTDAPNGVFASSSFVRTLTANGEYEQAAAFLPDESALEKLKSFCPTAFRWVVYLLLLSKTKKQLAACCEYSGGLENAVYRAVHRAKDYAEAVEALRCKTLTDAKIRRLLLFGALGVTKEQAARPPAYAHVLAWGEDETARALFRAARKAPLPPTKRIGTLRKSKTAADQYAFNALAEQILQAGSEAVENGRKEPHNL